ncbi:MAG: RluA family pseudouridine synthase [Anaerolineae bacterium]
MTDDEVRVLEVEADGERVDRYVADRLSALSRTAVQRLIDEGQITVDGERIQTSHRLRAGERIVVHIPAPEPVELQPEPIPLDVLYEDADLIVVNKPAGMVIHPGAGHRSGTLVNAILAHCPDLTGVGGEIRPGIVHRLDKETSGVIVIAKHDRALRALQRQFKRRTVEKRYTALAVGCVPQEQGLIEAPIARHRHHRRRMAVRAGGKMARTRWRVLGRYRGAADRTYTLLDLKLLTGRTHQIRVHLSWLGYPVAGDAVYGPAYVSELAPRQFLHARVLGFEHPGTGEPMQFTAPLPQDLQTVLEGMEPLD